jgi:hypothetical protein
MLLFLVKLVGDDKTPAGDGILGNDGKEDGDYDDDEDANADRNAADDDDTLRVNKVKALAL